MDIIAKEIGVEISNRSIFSGISIELKENKMFAITGKSGCGKTTMLNCLGLIQDLNSGDIIIDGSSTKNWNDKDKTKFWREKASFIYQDYGIIDNETILYNVTLSRNKKEYKNADCILENVGLRGRGSEYASVLSGGEKQRLGIARAIYKNAKIIFADEPTASLDAKNRELVVSLLRDRRDLGTMVVIATHDERLISECDENINIELLNNRGK